MLPGQWPGVATRPFLPQILAVADTINSQHACASQQVRRNGGSEPVDHHANDGHRLPIHPQTGSFTISVSHGSPYRAIGQLSHNGCSVKFGRDVPSHR